jgi:fatty-acid peroxygenase
MRTDVAYRLLVDRYAALDRLREEAGGGRWFEARMLGRRALVVQGEDGTRLFYDPTLVTRKGAIPAPLRLLLFGPGSIHNLDGEAHASRKQLHLDIVDRAGVEELGRVVAGRLEQAVGRWVERGTIRLFDELVEVYGTAVIEWAGIDVDPAEAVSVTRDLAAMVDAFGPDGASYPRGYLARIRAPTWARHLVKQVRAGERAAPEDSVLARVAARDDLGHTVAGVELLNVLRPSVAVAYFGAYAAHALAERPDRKARLAGGSPEELRAFEHEVRRWYPFVPLLTGRLVRDHTWEGRRFRKRSWMVLDILGTDLDPEHWADGRSFDPERFLGREPNPWEYVPHGGGDPAAGHRCPGEPLAVGILSQTIRVLAGLDYRLAEGEDTVATRRIPSLVPQHMKLHGVRDRATAPA